MRKEDIKLDDQHFQAGYKAWKYQTIDCCLEFKTQFGYDPKGGSNEWSRFNDGTRLAEYEYVAEQCKSQILQLNKMLDEAETAGIDINTGCGCCGAGFEAKGLDGNWHEITSHVLNPLEIPN